MILADAPTKMDPIFGVETVTKCPEVPEELLDPRGGPHGNGFIRGVTEVDPQAWFFAAHFFQDPVWPGSLGLEAFLQLLKIFAVAHWNLDDEEGWRFEPIGVGEKHEWTYRGQVIPTDKRVTVEASIESISDDARLVRAHGLLSVDGRVIYEMKDFALRVVRDEQSPRTVERDRAEAAR